MSLTRNKISLLRPETRRSKRVIEDGKYGRKWVIWADKDATYTKKFDRETWLQGVQISKWKYNQNDGWISSPLKFLGNAVVSVVNAGVSTVDGVISNAPWEHVTDTWDGATDVYEWSVNTTFEEKKAML